MQKLFIELNKRIVTSKNTLLTLDKKFKNYLLSSIKEL